MKIRRSIIWSIPKDEMQSIISTSTSIIQIMAKCGLMAHGANYATLRKRCAEEGINLTHLPRGSGANLGRKFGDSVNAPLLQPDSPSTRKQVKRYVLAKKLIPYACKICGNVGEWLGREMTLILDHENGKNNDHSISNLRLLCPNCNSQTITFCGRNCPKHYDNPTFHAREPKRRYVRPSKEKLIEMLLTKTFTEIASEFGVTPTSIRRWLHAYGLPTTKKELSLLV
jgi:HNH endonuclease